MIKDIYKSCRLLISKYPIVLLLQLYYLAAGIIETLIPVYIIKKVVDIYSDNKDLKLILIYILVGFLLITIINIISFIFNIVTTHIKRRFLCIVETLFFNKLSEIDYEAHESPEFLNEYTRALEESAENIYNTAEAILETIRTVVMSLSLFGVLFMMDSSIIIYAVIAGIIYVILRFIMSKIEFAARTRQRKYHRLNRYSERAFTLKQSMPEIKTSDIGDLLLEMNDDAHDNLLKIYDKYFLPKSILSFIGDLIMTLIYPGIICLLLMNKISDAAVFASMTVVATKISTLISSLTSSVGRIQSSAVEVRVPFKVLDMHGKIENDNGSKPDDFRSLDIDNLSFSYKGDKNQLEDISMHIKKGDHIAIVGTNGAGKTTLVKLLLRLYDPKNGYIKYNGVDYRELNVHCLRKQVGAVFQNVECYAVSIAENVLLRTPKNEEDYKLVIDALKFSGLYDYVMSLPKGVDTLVTREFDKEGAIFSGGQYQRLAIARGYAGGYNLFILDEPSSALDPIAEAQVYENMKELGKDKTLIFISHRLTTTVNADHIYLFDKGRIVEDGTHEELLNKNGIYAKMFNSQSKKYLGGDYDEESF